MSRSQASQSSESSSESSSGFSSESGLAPGETTAFGMTDRGHKREKNQDQYLIARLNKSMLVSSTSLPLEERIYGRSHGDVLLVADGMGGHAAGERASELAISHLIRRVLNQIHWHFHSENEESEFVESLKAMLKDANDEILTESTRDAEKRGMGTTLTMAYIVDATMYVVHAGDSRCYLVRGNDAQQITTDHTLARQMVESGGMKPEDEAGSRWSNVLWNVLGGSNDSELISEVHRVDLQAGDTVVLCSDGLHRYTDTKMVAKIAGRHPSINSMCQEFVRHALDSGGEDNVTVIGYRVAPDDDSRSNWNEDFETQFSESQISSGSQADAARKSNRGLSESIGGKTDPLAETWPDD